MPRINVKNGQIQVENGANQVAGQPWSVTVPVNNREMLRTYGEHACRMDTEVGGEVSGHKADVSVKVFSGENTVAEESRRVCAPLDFTPPDDPKPTFGPFDPEPGQYTVRAKVDPVGGGQTDTVERTVNVAETSNAPPAGDGGSNDEAGDDSGLPPFGDADNDGRRNFVDPEPQNPDVPGDSGGPFNIAGQLDKAMLLLGLLAFAWALSSASNTVEAVT